MKNLKINFGKIMIALCVIIVLGSCKKEKNNEGNNGAASNFTFQGASMKITDADYRSGNGDGAWLYFGTSDFNFFQIRFAGLPDYTIPIGTFTFKNVNPYNAATNYKGGQVIINNVSSEMTGGTVVIAKNGNSYNISVDATTAKGPVKLNYSGTLKKI